LPIASAIDHNSQAKMNEFYSDSKYVEAYIDAPRLRFFQEVVDVLRSKGIDYNDRHIADVGCGTGHLLLSIANVSTPASLTGFDYSDAALDVAGRVIPGAHLCAIDFCADVVPGQFDIIFCTQVLEHLLHPENAFRTIVRMLKPGGVALLTVPNGRIDTFAGHINFWSPESWKTFLDQLCGDCENETGCVEDGNVNFGIVQQPKAAARTQSGRALDGDRRRAGDRRVQAVPRRGTVVSSR
jgi:2-polyprenyl-3-methyl-5-hydroxy-6-metoxy-1,4-benzoquinol methylase